MIIWSSSTDNKKVRVILLVQHVDEIVIIGNDYARICFFKAFLHTSFPTKDLGQLKYILEVEVLSKRDFPVLEKMSLTCV